MAKFTVHNRQGYFLAISGRTKEICIEKAVECGYKEFQVCEEKTLPSYWNPKVLTKHAWPVYSSWHK